MDNRPLVSVVIPSYNHHDYVERAICSVLGQTYSNIELIVIDDGSTDGSVDRIALLADEFGFCFVKQANRGLTKTLNRALTMAKGEYFCEFSSDDFMSDDYILEQVLFMNEHADVGMVSARLIEVDAKGSLKSQKHDPVSIEHFVSFDDILFRGQNLPAPGMLFRKSALVAVDGYNAEIQLEDMHIQLKLTNAGWLIANNPVAVVYYRLHGKNNVLRHLWMAKQVLQTINDFSSHPNFKRIRKFWYLKLFKKFAKLDRHEAIKFLPEVIQYWYDSKFWHGLRRILVG